MITHQHICLFDKKIPDSMSFNSLGYFFEELAATKEVHFTTLFPQKFLVAKTFQLYSIDFLGIWNRLGRVA